MTYQPAGQPRVLNYSNELVSFPEYEEIDDLQIQSFRFTTANEVVLTGTKRAMNLIKLGYFLLFDTGSQTSQIRKIIGISRKNFKVIVDEEFTVSPQDAAVKIIAPITEQKLTVYNIGVATVYVNGEEVEPGENIYWPVVKADPPVLIYGTSAFQVSNGKIKDYGASAGTGGGSVRFRPTTIDSAYLEDSRLVAGLEDANIEVKYNENLLTEGVHYTLDMANNRLLADPSFRFIDTDDIFITIYYNN